MPKFKVGDKVERIGALVPMLWFAKTPYDD
jgi:hypothetical protein